MVTEKAAVVLSRTSHSLDVSSMIWIRIPWILPSNMCKYALSKTSLALQTLFASHLCHTIIFLLVSESQDNQEFQETLEKTNDCEVSAVTTVFLCLDDAMIGDSY